MDGGVSGCLSPLAALPRDENIPDGPERSRDKEDPRPHETHRDVDSGGHLKLISTECSGALVSPAALWTPGTGAGVINGEMVRTSFPPLRCLCGGVVLLYVNVSASQFEALRRALLSTAASCQSCLTYCFYRGGGHRCRHKTAFGER